MQKQSQVGKKARTQNQPQATVPRVTRGMTTRAARNAVFDTVELLEATLSMLPYKDLYLAQRVSKQWQSAIATSATLQREMFLKAPPQPHENAGRVRFEIEAHFRAKHPVAHPAYDFSEHAKRAVPNPLLKELSTAVRVLPTSAPQIYDAQSAWLSLPAFPPKDRDSRYGQFLTSPPCETVRLMVNWIDRGEHQNARCTLQNADGLRFLDVFAAVLLAPLRVKEADSLEAKSLGERLVYWRKRSGRPPRIEKVFCRFLDVVVG